MSNRVKSQLINFVGRSYSRVPSGVKRFLKPLLPGCRGFIKRLAASVTGEGVTGSAFGFRMHVDYADRVERAIALGLYEADYAQKFSASIRPGDVVVDVGAYCGYFTLIAAKKAGSEGAVYAFEPVVRNYRRLLRNIELNNTQNVTAVNQGLSDVPGRLMIHVPLELPSQSSIADRNWAEISRGGTWEKETLEASFVTLDGFFAEKNLTRADVIKIDAEGAEVKVLRGMKNVLSSFRPLLFMEIVPPVIQQAGDSLEALVRILQDCGFKKITSLAKGEHRALGSEHITDAQKFILSGGYTFIIEK